MPPFSTPGRVQAQTLNTYMERLKVNTSQPLHTMYSEQRLIARPKTSQGEANKAQKVENENEVTQKEDSTQMKKKKNSYTDAPDFIYPNHDDGGKRKREINRSKSTTGGAVSPRKSKR